MPQIAQIGEIYASQLFWLAIFFGAIFVVIGLGMLPKIQSTVDARDATIAADLEAARGARQAADSLEEGYRAEMLKTLKPELFANAQFGVITVKDILAELEKPGRDPRPDFKVARFNDGIEDIKDLKEGMTLEGTVSNVAAFGAFVDIGVHQDGLVHVSQLANKFVTDAREVVKTGDIVKVRVTEIDVARKRIGLTMKLGDAPPRQGGAAGPRDNRFESARAGGQNRSGAGYGAGGGGRQGAPQPATSTAMESAFSKLAGLKK